MASPTGTPQKLLLLDDDRAFLDLYRELLGSLPSQPEIFTAESGARAIAVLESEPFHVLLSDLRMAKMDGLQVLAVVRKKFPTLRTAIITGLIDEQFRARAYALGVDLFLQKPKTPEESDLFLHCIESLLGVTSAAGFRGVQSKSLVDIIQLECISQSSSTLKIVQGGQEGKVWFQNGEILDAWTANLAGRAAFHKILSWKTGNFEILPPAEDRKRVIFESYQGLLLEGVQAIDENRPPERETTDPAGAAPADATSLPRLPGVEFLLADRDGEKLDSWGLENAPQFARWTRSVRERFRALGDRWALGDLANVRIGGSQWQLMLLPHAGSELVIGLERHLSDGEVKQTVNDLLLSWPS
jgi:CheY-like chemotaxis protein